MEVEKQEVVNNVMCQLTDPDGNPLGNALYLPQDTGPPQLMEVVNSLLKNEEKLPYAFYISDEELVLQIGSYLQKKKLSVEKVLHIVYQPQAVFRIRPVNRCSATILGHAEAILCVAFSPDGRQLASGSGDTTVRFWDLTTQTPLFTCTGHKNWVLSISWSPDGKHLVSGSKAGELHCWDPQTGKQSGNTLTGHKKWITGIAWEPVHLQSPCRRFVSSSKDGDARVWDVVTRKCVLSLSGHTLAVTCVKWGGDGLIYTSSQDCTIKVWETKQGKLVRELKVSRYGISGFPTLKFFPRDNKAGEDYDGGRDLDDFVTFINRKAGTSRDSKGHLTSQAGVVSSLSGLVKELVDAAEDERKAVLSRIEEEVEKLEGSAAGAMVTGFNTLALNTEYVLRTGAFDHTGKQYSSPEEMKKVALERYTKMKGNVPERLVSGSDDFTMFLWEPAISKHPKARMTGHQQLVNHVCFSPDGQWVASASFDKSVKLWNGTTGNFVAVFRGHVGPVYQISWSADSRLLLSGSKDSTLKVWEMRTKKLKMDLPGHADEVFAVDWSPDGEKVASGGKDKAMKLWMN